MALLAIGLMYASFIGIGWLVVAPAGRRARRRRRVHGRRPGDAAVAGDVHHDRDVGGRRLPARHRRGRLPVEPGERPAGRRLLRHQPDHRRPVLRAADARARVPHADRSVRGALRREVGGGAGDAGGPRRNVLERGAAGRARLHLRRRPRSGPGDRHRDLGGGGHALHDGRRDVGGGLHRRVPAGAGRRRPRRGAAVCVVGGRRDRSCVGCLPGRAACSVAVERWRGGTPA